MSEFNPTGSEATEGSSSSGSAGASARTVDRAHAGRGTAAAAAASPGVVTRRSRAPDNGSRHGSGDSGVQPPSTPPQCDDAAADTGPAPPPPRLNLLTLRLSPASAEARFWRAVGAPAYARSDRYALVFTIFNIVLSTVWVKNSNHLEHVPRWFSIYAHVHNTIFIPLAVICRVWISVDQRSYEAAREPLAMVQRLARSLFMLILYSQMDIKAWRMYVLRKHGEGPLLLAPPDAARAMLRSLTLFGMFWAMHALLFPVALAKAVPAQILVSVAGWYLARGQACFVASDPAMHAGATLLCSRLYYARTGVLVALGLAPDAMPVPACAAAPMEMLVPLFSAVACLLTLLALYERELAHKAQFLRSLNRETQGDVAFAPPALRCVVGATTAVLASFAIAEAAVRFGRPYAC